MKQLIQFLISNRPCTHHGVCVLLSHRRRDARLRGEIAGTSAMSGSAIWRRMSGVGVFEGAYRPIAARRWVDVGVLCVIGESRNHARLENSIRNRQDSSVS